MKKNQGVSVVIEGSGSSNGIKAILEGSCDIANASREMKEKELETAKKNSIAVEEIVVAYDMIVPVVHPSNPVKNLTSEQLKAIYKGEITNWKEVGGKDLSIVVISRDTSSGTFEIWNEKIMKKEDVFPRALLQASNGAIVNVIANNDRAIGYIGYGYLNNSIKGLTVNDIVPTLKNGKSGKYPISRKLYMYVNRKNYSANTRKFIKFLLSKEGQKAVEEAGFIKK
jgi:phosphate transport system substrate-binding protein